ncbi:hypothetical protein LSM04_003254 [Trypanosoma melophagium]|uniref:uncharacterized protein n=1 Tax=Trypanosoma melophagium TaxID=715481 RepID=UPI00351A1644|nr:hypothetical protein LSM04_003254 [Trypanosoma melophagium]
MRNTSQVDQSAFCIETVPALFLVLPVICATTVRCRAIVIVPIIALTPLCMFAFRSYVMPYPLALLSEHFFRPTIVTLISVICVVQLLVAEGRMRCVFHDTTLLHAEAERVSQQRHRVERKPSSLWSSHSLRRVISFNRTICGTLAILEVCDFAVWSCTPMPHHVVNCMITLHTAFDETLRAIHVKKLRHRRSLHLRSGN